MNSDNGELSFSAVIDTSGFDDGINHITNAVQQAGADIEAQSASLQNLFTDIPQVNIEVVTNASASLDSIQAGFEQIDSVIMQNEAAIQELDNYYNQLSQTIAAMPDGVDSAEAQELKAQAGAIKENIAFRKQIVSEAQGLKSELKQTENALKGEASQMQNSSDANKDAKTSFQSLSSQIKDVKEQMAQLRVAGKEATPEYQALSQELGRLMDIKGDIAAQGKVFANDEQQIAGLIQGVGLLSGGFAAAQGAMMLFGEENKELNELMMKSQALMSITMGLQQLQQTLNKDSTFQLVTLNGLKQWWNKITGQTAVETAAETAAIEANTVANAENAAAGSAAGNAKGNLGKAAANNTKNIAANTAATKAAATAQAGGTVATKGLAGGFKILGNAIKSIPVFGWIIAGIAGLVAVFKAFTSEASKAQAELEEFHNKVSEATAEPIMKFETLRDRWNSLSDDMAKTEFLEKNKKSFDELGFSVNSVEEAERLLNEQKDKYIKYQMEKAAADIYAAQIKEKLAEKIKLQQTIEEDNFGFWETAWARMTGGASIAVEAAANNSSYIAAKTSLEVKQLDADIEKIMKKATDASNRADELVKEIGLDTTEDAQKSNKNAQTNKDTFDYKKAERERKNALLEYSNAVSDYTKKANEDIAKASTDAMEDGLDKELAKINEQTEAKKEAWRKQLEDIAKIRKEASKRAYMSQKGATEEGWEKTAQGKMTDDDWVNDLMQESGVSESYYKGLEQIVAAGEKQIQTTRKNYSEQMVKDFGSAAQRYELVYEKWLEKISKLPPEYIVEAQERMKAELSGMDAAEFKIKANFDLVMGDLAGQSTGNLLAMQEKIQTYLEENADKLSEVDFNEFSAALENVKNAIASNNPFALFHKSLNDIVSARDGYLTALSGYQTAIENQTSAQEAYNFAIEEKNRLQAEVEAGNLSDNSEEYLAATQAAATATIELQKSTNNAEAAERKLINSRNGVTDAYRKFASSLQGVKNTTLDVADSAAGLAEVFSEDVAKGISTAINVLETVIDTTTNLVEQLAPTADKVIGAITSTVDGATSGMVGASTAASTAIKTVETASVILTVISAALQIATAIAKAFDRNAKINEQIEKNNAEIERLQWNLDNLEGIKINEVIGGAFGLMQRNLDILNSEVVGLGASIRNSILAFSTSLDSAREYTGAYQKTIEKLAGAYAKVEYAAGKALGSDKFNTAQKQLENYAKQQVEIYKNIEAEQSKKEKKQDSSKIEEWQQKIIEIGEKSASVVSGILEEIVGADYSSLAENLGGAFFDAVSKGEDAMEAWHGKVNEIVGDIIKRMLITNNLEKPIQQAMNSLQRKMFDDSGNFKGSDAALNAMASFEKDLDRAGQQFNTIYNALGDNLKKYFDATDESTREGTAKGIATASQDSVDENNARLTTIQGHTYSLVSGVSELNATSNQVLLRLTGIESNTSQSNVTLREILTKTSAMQASIDEMNVKGIRVK